MRFLCFHGRGTNSDIFETQLGPLKSLLKTDVEFDFIDAPFEDAPAPGIENFFEPPYFVWNRFYAPPKVSEVHKYVREIVAREANHKYPYDGVIGFSEGAALAAALLLEDASNPDQWCAPIFKIAVFINAVNIVSPSTTLGKKMHESDMQHAMDTFTRADDKHHSPALDCVYALCSNTVPALITIPTLHIVGTKDYFRESSEDLVKLCERGTATVVRSTAGHEMPRDQKLKEMAGQLDKMIKAELMST